MFYGVFLFQHDIVGDMAEFVSQNVIKLAIIFFSFLDGYDRNNEEHHERLLSIMMTTSDLSDQTKSWESAVKVSDLLYAEFFNQGDMVCIITLHGLSF